MLSLHITYHIKLLSGSGILLILSIALLLLAFVKEGKDLATAAAKKSNNGFNELEEEPEANDKF